ncbi:helix-turn-helix transcriptional regulator [Sphingobium boeckii]|uniref:DNA-binding CsgD family transcriptional regulator n=1 Tax=Sphingobium boeckii TaxID=1082345 RepID=A0A7W9ALD6_9SPHN|nr:helix-turn-helix transcriptional regulator [Sphingobium boeckii]MBB5687820.1 DNA-binding CsgD family transcriptional regulator [Sphingobium boeckii]
MVKVQKGRSGLQSTYAELTDALLVGVYETPLWSTFLDRLRAVTRADHAILMFQPPNRPIQEVVILLAGVGSVSSFKQSYLGHFSSSEPIAGSSMVENKAVPLERMLSMDSFEDAARRRQFADQYGVKAGRQMLVREPSGIGATLSIARHEAIDFTAQDELLLESLAPILRGVLRLYISSERANFAASVAEEATRRLRFGWIALDADGHILDNDDQAGRVLSSSKVLSRGSTGRLTAQSSDIADQIARALKAFAEDPSSRPRALPLSREPWLDMLLTPAWRTTIAMHRPATAIAYIHGDSWHSSDRCQLLGELFGLLPREAKLAFALSRGMTLTEAAEHFGWTTSTARTYSKSIYAKTGARGLPDLVRLVMRSVLAIDIDT